MSFEPPSPQLFSFNSPQGMCPECSGLGQIYTFDPERLIPDPSRSFQQGCIELLGKWRDMGRWRRHIFRGVAEIARAQARPGARQRAGNGLGRTRSHRSQQALLWGTGERAHHLHLAERRRRATNGAAPSRASFPSCSSQYRTTRSRLQRRQLEKYMCILGCRRCGGRRLNAQACRRDAHHAPRRSLARPPRAEPAGSLPRCPSATPRSSSRALELDANGQTIAAEALKEIRSRLRFLKNVGLEYLTLDRTAPTLSGGEMQRIRLAGQIGCGLVGVLYILDEPSIGLHPRDNDKLLETLAQLRDQGNTVIVVEHDEDTMRAADHIVDFGPGPGRSRRRDRRRRIAGRGDRPAQRASPASTSPAAADRRPCRPPRPATATSPRGPRRTAQQPARTSTSRSPWACSSASPGYPARARVRWSATSSSRRCGAT